MKILAADYITDFNPCMHIFRQIAFKKRGPVMKSDFKVLHNTNGKTSVKRCYFYFHNNMPFNMMPNLDLKGWNWWEYIIALDQLYNDLLPPC